MIRTGIDFGTSMTMMQTMDGQKYEAGSTDCRPIRFTQNQEAATPTLVRTDPSGVHSTCYGAAARDSQWGKLNANFKLLSEDNPEGQALIEQFFTYLRHCYETECTKLYPDRAGEKEETMVGYPVQWSENRRNAILAAAEKAGFQNVQGKNEAEASVICALTHCQQELPKGRPISILVLDMGAGTTDLAFVEVRVEDGNLNTTLRGVWPPKEQGDRFGGSDLDACLEGYVARWLESCGLDNMGAGFVQNYLSSNRPMLKSWKENEVSKALSQNLEITGCALGDWLFNLPGVTLKPFPAFGREGFEKLAKKELDSFVRILASAPEEWRRDTELVILTGGNSQWYWVSQLLLEENSRFGSVGLPLLAGHPERLLALTFPTEVVSRGLVYNPGKIRFRQPRPVKEQKNVDDKAAKEEVNIHEQWRNKLAQGKYPDMRLMKRIRVVDANAIAVADSGHVLVTNPEDHPLRADVVEIAYDYGTAVCYRCRDGAVVNRLNEDVQPTEPFIYSRYVLDTRPFKPFKRFIPVTVSPERVPEVDRCIYPSGLYGVGTHVGLCKNGSICFEDGNQKKAFLERFPSFSDNGDSTVGQNIVDLRSNYFFDLETAYGCKIVVLYADGSVEYYIEGSQPNRLFNYGAVSIDYRGTTLYVLLENGALFAIPAFSNVEAQNRAQWSRFDGCVAYCTDGDSAVFAIDQRGNAHWFNTPSKILDIKNLKKRRMVENWNIHDL